MSVIGSGTREMVTLAPSGARGRARRVVSRVALALLPIVLAYAALLVFSTATTSFADRALDFTPYYAAAAALRDDPGANIYDRAVLLRAAAEHPGCLLWPGAAYLYPPLLAMLLVPLTFLPYDVAFHCWMIFNLVLWAICAGLLASWLRVMWRGGREEEESALVGVRVRRLLRGEPDDGTLALLVAVAVAAFTWPVLEGLLMGQVHLLVLALLLVAPLLVRRGHLVAAGGLLALAMMIKLLPVVLIVYYATRGRWRVVLGTALLLAVTVVVTGPAQFVNAAVALGEVSARQGWYANQALGQAPALVAAAFGGGDGPLVWIAGWALVGLAGLVCVGVVLVAGRVRGAGSDEAGELLGYGWAICAMLIVAPLVWIHYNAWLLLPVVLCLGYALRARREGGRRRLPGWVLPLLGGAYALIFLPWSIGVDALPLGAGPHLLGVAVAPLALLLHPLSALALFGLAGWLYLREQRMWAVGQG